MIKDRKFTICLIFSAFFVITTIIGFILYVTANRKVNNANDADITIDSIQSPVEGRIYDSLLLEYAKDTNRLNIKYAEAIDSLNYYKQQYDSVNEELFMANYKLERIREYNRIAAQGNNITFLRGWINRVLNE